LSSDPPDHIDPHNPEDDLTQQEFFDELDKVVTSLDRTGVFLKGAEKEAGLMERRELQEFKNNLNKFSVYLINNFGA